MSDTINHPKHYNSHPSGVECIDVAEHMGFNVGNAIKYLWRYEGKNGLEDLKKAQWHITREIVRLSDATPPDESVFDGVQKHGSVGVIVHGLRAVAKESLGGISYWFNKLADELERT